MSKATREYTMACKDPRVADWAEINVTTVTIHHRVGTHSHAHRSREEFVGQQEPPDEPGAGRAGALLRCVVCLFLVFVAITWKCAPVSRARQDYHPPAMATGRAAAGTKS